jgi:hypothetical protein
MGWAIHVGVCVTLDVLCQLGYGRLGAAIWKSWIKNSITTPMPINPIERLFEWSKASVRTVGAVYDRAYFVDSRKRARS